MSELEDGEDFEFGEEDPNLFACELLIKDTISVEKCLEKAKDMSNAQLEATLAFSRDYLEQEENQPHPVSLLGYEQYEKVLKKAAALNRFCLSEIEFRTFSDVCAQGKQSLGARRI
jgi:hypothetical protein